MKRILLHVVDMRTADYVISKLQWLFSSHRFKYIKETTDCPQLVNLAVTSCDERPIDSKQIELLFYFTGHYEADFKQYANGY